MSIAMSFKKFSPKEKTEENYLLYDKGFERPARLIVSITGLAWCKLTFSYWQEKTEETGSYESKNWITWTEVLGTKRNHEKK